MFQKKVVEKVKTQLYIRQNFSENHAVHEIMYKNMADTDRPQAII
jgi:hypothetical protein